MSRFFQREGGFLLLGGDTFPIKDEIKSVGARWDGKARQWVVREAPDVLVALEGLGFFARTQSATIAPVANPQVSMVAPDSALTPITAIATEGAPRLWTVGEFVTLVERLIAQHLSSAFWIIGEVTSLRVSNGHCYFDLAERAEEREGRVGRAQSVSCVLWAGRRQGIERERGLGAGELPLTEGVSVKILVHAEFRKEQARIALVVDDCDPEFTLGGLAIARAAIVRELKKRGLYDLNKRHTLLPFPLRVALVTAEGSRAHTDFLDELLQSGLAFSVTLFDCHMQGEKTAPDVGEALSRISREPQSFDVVVVTRGGGSRLDLRWFDDLGIAKAIANCPLPVVTAIGHFEDLSIADEVSHFAEKTPTGAAGYLIQHVGRSFERCREGLARGATIVTRRVRAARETCDRGEASLVQSVRRRLALEESRLRNYAQTLRIVRSQSAKPLTRGFALAQTESGQVLSAADFLTGTVDELRLVLFDAKTSTDVRVRARVLDVHASTAENAGEATFKPRGSGNATPARVPDTHSEGS